MTTNLPAMNSPGPPDKSGSSDPSDDLHRLLPKHGGYRKLRSFQAALATYDATMVFCHRFIEKRSRTHDQMVQAARSGVRNISEGSVDSGTSKKTELKLTNIARGSLEELMGDYEDFLRNRGLPTWDKDSPQALAARQRLSTHFHNYTNVFVLRPERHLWESGSCHDAARMLSSCGRRNAANSKPEPPNIRCRISRWRAPE
jgi:four helix bundle protein